jgi:spore coat polysaccharide biosynthesis protein SpsF (cytidylyltransferase family)
MTQKVVAIIQARLGSSRLPGKVLMDIAGRPMIEHVIERAQAIHGVDHVVLNVPAQDAAAFGKQACRIYGVPNQEQDVLASYLYVAEQEQADVIMRITGDCPLLAPEICRDVLDLYTRLDDAWAYCTNDTLRSGWPDGTDCEVFSIDALRKAAKCAETAGEREHVTIWLRKELPNYGGLAPCGWEPDMKNIKLSVDTHEDLACVRSTYQHLQPGQFSITDTVTAWRASRGTV